MFILSVTDLLALLRGFYVAGQLGAVLEEPADGSKAASLHKYRSLVMRFDLRVEDRGTGTISARRHCAWIDASLAMDDLLCRRRSGNRQQWSRSGA